MEKNKGGRPSKYDPKMNEQVFKLCLLGADDSQIANFFEVTETTINNWKISEPEFFESLKRGKEEADMNVVNSLYRRALGYEYVEVKEEGEKVARTTKEIIPDVTAQIFWLKNRQKDKWRDVKDNRIEGEVIISERLKESEDRVKSYYEQATAGRASVN